MPTPTWVGVGTPLIIDMPTDERIATAMVAQMAGANTAKGPLVYLADALKAAERT